MAATRGREGPKERLRTVVVDGFSGVYVLPIEEALKGEQVGTSGVLGMRHPLLQPRRPRGGEYVVIAVLVYAPAVIRNKEHILHDVHPDGVPAGGCHQAVLQDLVELVRRLYHVQREPAAWQSTRRSRGLSRLNIT